MNILKQPILVISTTEAALHSLSLELEKSEVTFKPCSTFLEAEEYALNNLCSGILVDLASIVKAKGEEKLISCSLTNFFPTLRVKVMGNLIIPMTMPGAPRQESSLSSFINNACASFTPRPVRKFARHNISLSCTLIKPDIRLNTFTINVSWGGCFVVDLNPERFSVGDFLELNFHEVNLSAEAEVIWIKQWGSRNPSGIGLRFRTLQQGLESLFIQIFKRDREHDRDRIVG